MGVRKMYILESEVAGPRRHSAIRVLSLRLEFEPEDISFHKLVNDGRTTKNREKGNFNGAAHPERGNQDQIGTPVEHAFHLGHGYVPKLEDMVREDYVRNDLDGYGYECRGTKCDYGVLFIQGEWDKEQERSVPFQHGPDGFIDQIETSPRGGKDKIKILRGVPFVFGIVGEHHVDFRGLYIPRNRLRRSWWREDLPRQCYGVPQEALFSLIPLFDPAEGVLKSAPLAPRVLLQKWYLKNGKPQFDVIQKVPVGQAITREEADQTGVVLIADSEDYFPTED